MSFTPPPPKPVSPGLYLVATPIGNLRDITLRALDVLAAADVVLAEDTRVTGKLLSAYGLSKKLVRYDEHVAAQAGPRILEDLAAGKVVAQVSDAGTPLISDPGQVLAREAAAAGYPVHPIPGPSSVLAALSVAGLPTERFLFTGFLPPKSGARRARLEELATSRATLVLFETGPRLRASLEDMAEVLGADRPAAVARELTKLHEELRAGTLAELADYYSETSPRGELTIVMEGTGTPPAPPDRTSDAMEEAAALLAQGLTRREVARRLTETLGLPRNDAYRLVMGLP